jgi:protein gp37
MTTLVKYQAAKRALAQAVRVDEAKDIRDKAVAMQEYARQANDPQLIQWATEIKIRAERRTGELLKETAATGQRQTQARGGSTVSTRLDTVPPTLKDLGITRDQSSDWQKLAALPEKEFERRVEAAVAKPARETARRILHIKPVAPTPERGPTYSVEAWVALAPADRRRIVAEAAGGSPFNAQDTDSIEWARWSWNPVTGCLHNCAYCYARDIAMRFYPQQFAPTFLPHRLTAPAKTVVPERAAQEIGYRNVFVCSMADLFGKWVPEDWITAVFERVRAHPEWNFLFLTKFPQRLAERDWPDNAWCGTTVDTQERVKIAEKAFRGVTAGVRWLSVEPMMERLTFTSLEMFNWIVIGGATASTQTEAFDPPMEWVRHLLDQVETAKISHVYAKANLYALRGYPGRSVARSVPA